MADPVSSTDEYIPKRTSMMTAMLLATVALSACSSSPITGVLRSFSLADVQAAKVDADLHADATASLCYKALIDQIQNPHSPPVGVVSAYQIARDARRYATSEALHAACGPLAVDALLAARLAPW